MLPSPISKISLGGRKFYVKRDDLVDPFLAGNKFRKLHSLLKTPKEKYTKIISYGGTQSNAMLAIAALCKKKSWEFIYYSKPLSQTIKEQTYGNFFLALELGMKHIEIEHTFYRDFVASLRIGIDDKTFLIDQGGASAVAEEGLKVLATEIKDANLEVKSVAIPSGTGTTALFLAQSLPEYKVYTIACVGTTEYLKEQMKALAPIPDNLFVLEVSKKYHFAKPYLEFITIHKQLLDTGIEFDLLYSPLMWKAILEQVEEDILYIHSGGVSGNSSMLKRYEKKSLSF